MTKQYRSKIALSRRRMGFATIRLPGPTPAFLIAGTLVWGCAVYDSELLATNGDLTGGGGSAGKSTSAGGSQSTAGKATSGGTLSTGGSSSGGANGGTGMSPTDAGAGGDLGDGGESPTMIGGSGGKAGGGGTGGTGGGGTGGTAGSGGSGGTAAMPCAEHPLSSKPTWTARAFHSSLGNGTEADGLYNPPEHMIDGKLNERWSSENPQSGGEWVQINFGVVVTLTDLTLDVTGNVNDYPRAYEVRISDDPAEDAKALPTSPYDAKGVGAPGNTAIHFVPPITGQYLTVHQTGMNAVGVTSWWSISEVLVGCTNP
jgi:hypothetical protein